MVSVKSASLDFFFFAVGQKMYGFTSTLLEIHLFFDYLRVQCETSLMIFYLTTRRQVVQKLELMFKMFR